MGAMHLLSISFSLIVFYSLAAPHIIFLTVYSLRHIILNGFFGLKYNGD